MYMRAGCDVKHIAVVFTVGQGQNGLRSNLIYDPPAGKELMISTSQLL